MSQPDSTTWDPREDLSLKVEEVDLEMQRSGYVASRILPIVTRGKPEGKVPRVPLEQQLQNLDTKRDPKTGYARSEMTFSDDNYSTTEHGLEATLDDRLAARYDDILDAEVYEGQRIEHALLTSYEREVVDYVTTAGNFSGRTDALTIAWSARATSVPITDIDEYREAVYMAYGEEPDTLVVDRSTLRDLANSLQLVDRMKYQGFQDVRNSQLVNEAAVASALDLKQIIVANSIYNSANVGGTRSLARVWPNTAALLLKIGDTGTEVVRGYGRTMMWDQESTTDGSEIGIIAESYYEDSRRGDVLRRRTDWGIKIWHPEAAYLITNVTA